MVKVKKDLTGMRVGKLTVLYQAEDHVSYNGIHRSAWFCQCECGNFVTIIGSHLTQKNQPTLSCGCLNKEVTRKMKKKYNEYKVNLVDEFGLYGIGYCSNTKNEFYFDMEDYDLIKQYCWHEWINNKSGYRSLLTYQPNQPKTLKMTALLGCKGYDHIDRNPLNNRRTNLRPATQADNVKNTSRRSNNTSGIIGVGWYKPTAMWQARIGINGKLIRIGFFLNKDDAIRARLNAEVKYFGEFAPQRHLFKQYNINYTTK